ncbi:MAG: large conductance mechanosensitive channel protein MscL [Coriobacteriia bacterium]|nr:large conductance mechanosensitive channel protein MscL [Coriobacteriia bacterium]
MFKEFKEFALKGNVIDLAVGVVVGSAFGGIVAALVESIINPILGFLIGDYGLSDLSISLGGQIKLAYGAFLSAIINFLLIALVLFLVTRLINRFRREGQTTSKTCPFCLTEIPVAATRCSACTSELS